MTKTVTSLFQHPETAADAVTHLEQIGIENGAISAFTGSDDDLVSHLDRLGLPSSDAQAFAEGVRRGGALVVVECADDAVDQVTTVLDGAGVLDLDEQQKRWRSEGWSGGGAVGSSSDRKTADLSGSRDRPGTGFAGGTTTRRSDAAGDAEVIPVAEEELHVGKREVGQGRVRIHSRVIESPVQEQVTLRDETIEVERRPASGRPVSGDPFHERTIEVEERDEEAVISKEARIKEEVVVRKGVEQREQTISDTVRKTEIDVEDDRDGRATGATGSSARKR